MTHSAPVKVACAVLCATAGDALGGCDGCIHAGCASDADEVGGCEGAANGAAFGACEGDG